MKDLFGQPLYRLQGVADFPTPLQAVARREQQVGQGRGVIQHPQFASGDGLYLDRQATHRSAAPNQGRVLVAKVKNHAPAVRPGATTFKRLKQVHRPPSNRRENSQLSDDGRGRARSARSAAWRRRRGRCRLRSQRRAGCRGSLATAWPARRPACTDRPRCTGRCCGRR